MNDIKLELDKLITLLPILPNKVDRGTICEFLRKCFSSCEAVSGTNISTPPDDDLLMQYLRDYLLPHINVIIELFQKEKEKDCVQNQQQSLLSLQHMRILYTTIECLWQLEIQKALESNVSYNILSLQPKLPNAILVSAQVFSQFQTINSSLPSVDQISKPNIEKNINVWDSLCINSLFWQTVRCFEALCFIDHVQHLVLQRNYYRIFLCNFYLLHICDTQITSISNATSYNGVENGDRMAEIQLWQELKESTSCKLRAFLQGSENHSIKWIVMNIRVLMSLARSFTSATTPSKIVNPHDNWLQYYASNYLTEILLHDNQQGVYHILLGYLEHLTPTSPGFSPLLTQLSKLFLKIPTSMIDRKEEYVVIILQQLLSLFQYAKATQDTILMTSTMVILTYFSSYYPHTTYRTVYLKLFPALYALYPLPTKVVDTVTANTNHTVGSMKEEIEEVVVKPWYLLANKKELQESVDCLYLFLTFLPSFATGSYYLLSNNNKNDGTQEEKTSSVTPKEIPNLGKLFHEVDAHRLIQSIMLCYLKLINTLYPLTAQTNQESLVLDNKLPEKRSFLEIPDPVTSSSNQKKLLPSSLLLSSSSSSNQLENKKSKETIKARAEKEKAMKELEDHLGYIILKYLPLYAADNMENTRNEKSMILVRIMEKLMLHSFAFSERHSSSSIEDAAELNDHDDATIIGEYNINISASEMEMYHCQHILSQKIKSLKAKQPIEAKKEVMYSFCQFWLQLYQRASMQTDSTDSKATTSPSSTQESNTNTNTKMNKMIVSIASSVYIDALQSFLLSDSADIDNNVIKSRLQSNCWKKADAAVIIDCMQEYLPFEWLLTNRIQIFTLFTFLLQNEIERFVTVPEDELLSTDQVDQFPVTEEEGNTSLVLPGHAPSSKTNPTVKPLITDLSISSGKNGDDATQSTIINKKDKSNTITKANSTREKESEEEQDMMHYVLTILSMILFYDPMSANTPDSINSHKNKESDDEEVSLLKGLLPILQQLLLLLSHHPQQTHEDYEELIMSIMQQIIVRSLSTTYVAVIPSSSASIQTPQKNKIFAELIRIERDYLYQLSSPVLRAYGIRLLHTNICQQYPIDAWYSTSNNQSDEVCTIWSVMVLKLCQSLCDADSYVYLTTILMIQRIYSLLTKGSYTTVDNDGNEIINAVPASHDYGNSFLLLLIRLYTNHAYPQQQHTSAINEITLDSVLNSLPALPPAASCSTAASSSTPPNPATYIKSHYRLRMMISEILQQCCKKQYFFPNPQDKIPQDHYREQQIKYTVQSLQYLFLQCLQYSKLSIKQYLQQNTEEELTTVAKKSKSKLSKSQIDEIFQHVNVFTGIHATSSQQSDPALSSTPTTPKDWTEDENELLEQLYIRQSALSLLAELVVLPLPFSIHSQASSDHSRLVDTLPSTEYLWELLDICQGILLCETSYAGYDRTARRVAMFVFKHMIQYNHEYFFLIPQHPSHHQSSYPKHPLIQTTISSSAISTSRQSEQLKFASSINPSIQPPKNDTTLLNLSENPGDDNEGQHRGYEYLKMILHTMRSGALLQDTDSVVQYQRKVILQYLQECTVHYLGIVRDSEDTKHDEFSFLRVVE